MKTIRLIAPMTALTMPFMAEVGPHVYPQTGEYLDWLPEPFGLSGAERILEGKVRELVP